MNVDSPSLYKCGKCGSKAISPTSDLVLKNANKVTKRQEEQICNCGEAFRLANPLVVYTLPPQRHIGQVIFTCLDCRKAFRRVSPSRVVCPSCPAVGHIAGREVWFENDRFTAL